jgi:glutamate synthase (NADPH/NADH) small chain
MMQEWQGLMANNKKNQPTVQPVAKRMKNFAEVSLGLSKAQAISECQRCPQCSHPECVKACPLGIDIPSFIRMVREGDFSKALQKIRESNSLTGVCGRICSAPCETACILNREKNPQPIAIRNLERAAFDYGHVKLQEIFNAQRTNKTGKKVAIIGSGAAGLMAGANLVEDGHGVTIFEALQKAGGFLYYGVPEFRLPKKILEAELAYVSSLGVEVNLNMMMGQTETISQLFGQGYDAVLLATGICFSQGFELPGREAKGVFTSQEFLFRMNFMNAYLHPKVMITPGIGKNVAIIGSGFDAIDCSRLALRLGRKVTLVHASTEDDLEVSSEDKLFAAQEGLVFESFAKPVEILKDKQGAVRGLRCVRVDFADQDGQWKLLAVKDSEFIIEVDTVILSGLYKANSFMANMTQGLKVNKQGFLSMKKEQSLTSLSHVFAAGGVAQGPLSLISTLANGKKVANDMDVYLQNQKEK